MSKSKFREKKDNKYMKICIDIDDTTILTVKSMLKNVLD